jgi:thiosulfate/3-mercaptopyruvate sulfurtransferase
VTVLHPKPQLLVEPEWLAEHLNDPRVHVIDCTVHMIAQPVGASVVASAHPDYLKAHIPGAHYVHMVEDLSDPNGPFAYALANVEHISALLRSFGVNDGDTIVLYGAAWPQVVTRAWWVFTASGAEDVRILNGGWQGWVRAGLPVSQELPKNHEGNFQGRRVDSMLATRADVEKAMRDGSACLANALTPEQFTGTGGAHYGRPGRIPGSVSTPNRDLIDPATGRYRPMKEMSEIFEREGVLDRDRIITYCGGGIAASGASFALAMLGHQNVALYDGSLLEWSKDESLPMEVG